MLQIAIFLLCVYLVFKGKELKLLAALQTGAGREQAMHNALRWFLASVVIAILFAIWALNQGSSMPSPGM